MIDIDVISPEDLYDVLGAIEPWPEWLPSLRPYQAKAIHEILTEYSDGRKVVVLSAPTGAGKTVIAEGVRRGLQGSGVFLCSTKSLQKQFLEDFPTAKLLQGRGNYKTLDGGPLLTKLDCDIDADKRCTFCNPSLACPYTVARESALNARLAVLNTSYWLYSANYTQSFIDRKLTVVDEGDLIGDLLCDFAGVTIPAKYQEELNIDPPSNVSDVDKFNTLLPEWASEAALKISNYARTLSTKKEKEAALGVATNLRIISNNPDDATFIMEGTRGRKAEIQKRKASTKAKDGHKGYRLNPLVIKAVESRPVAFALTELVDKLLIMSATILSADDMAYKLNLPKGEWASVEVDSPFEPYARPVVIRSDAIELTGKVLADGLPDQTANDVESIINGHPGERILVHTPSYKLASQIAQHVPSNRQIFTYKSSDERDASLAAWLHSADGVLVSPSFARGLDLKGDLCRVQIVSKIPYGSLGSPQVAARLYSTAKGFRRLRYNCLT